MRAVVVAPGPEFSVMDVYNGWCKGLRAQGVDVVEFNFNHRLALLSEMMVERGDELIHAFDLAAATEVAFEMLQSTLYRCWPDLIVVVSGHFFDDHLFDDIRRTRPQKVVMVHTESPYEEDRQLRLSEHVDLNILNDPTHLDLYRDGTIYVPHAYDPEVHHPNGRSSTYDFSFIGTGYVSRVEYLEKVEMHGARAALAGNWPELPDDSPLSPLLLNARNECCDNKDTADIYRASDMSVNLYRREADRPELSEGWAMGPREVELAACGTFFARDPRPEGDGVFPMLPKVTCPSELSDVIEWSMTHPEERQRAADAARAAIQDRTFSSNAGRMLRSLGV